MSVLGYVAAIEVDVLFVMALLAILGYSVNDTIVVFDRVRENLMANRTEKRTKREDAGIAYEEVEYSLTKPYGEIVGASIKDTLARSINTSMTTFVALAALYFIGSDATQTFALILMVGVFFGTYSSICIASPLVVIYSEWRNKKTAVK
jgi:preprotein translocase SecF subunit